MKMTKSKFYATWWASPVEAHVIVYKDGVVDSSGVYYDKGGSVTSDRLVRGRVYRTEYDVSPSALVLRVVDMCVEEGFPSHRLSIKVPALK